MKKNNKIPSLSLSDYFVYYYSQSTTTNFCRDCYVDNEHRC